MGAFPDIAWTEKCGKPEFLRNYVMMEVGDSLIEERLTVFSGTEAPMNADTVFVFRTALKNVYKGYSYCTSIYALQGRSTAYDIPLLLYRKGKGKRKAISFKVLQVGQLRKQQGMENGC